MRRASKSVNTSVLDFSDFSGGLNLLAAPENIEMNELSGCVNMTYSSQPGRLCSRPCNGAPVATFAGNIQGMCWYAGALYIIADSKLWKHATESITEIGSVTGTEFPRWCTFGADLYFAAGAGIYKCDGSTVTLLSNSPATAAGVYSRAGRLYCWSDDYIYGSAVGDPTIWAIPATRTDADAVEIQIGYKVAGKIVNVVPLLTDVIIFKENIVMRLVGEGPSWTSVLEVTRDEEIANVKSAANIAGGIFFIDRHKGMRYLAGTDSYGDIIPSDTMGRVNTWIRGNIKAGCGLWHLRARKILMVGSGGNICLPAFYDYGIDSMPSLMWSFDDDLIDVVEPDRDNLFVAVGKNIYNLNAFAAIDCSFETKRLTNDGNFLIKRISVDCRALEPAPNNIKLRLLVNDKLVIQSGFGSDESPDVYGNLSAVDENGMSIYATFVLSQDFVKHNTMRERGLMLKMQSIGAPAFELSKMTVEVVPVGVIG